MKTEQEVRDAITEEITRFFRIDHELFPYVEERQIILSKEEVQDLAVIIGKALGVVE